MQKKNVIIYDDECLFCRNYIRLLRLRETLNGVDLLDARDSIVRQEYGFNAETLNNGMVLILDGIAYHGSEAMHRIALLSGRSKLLNKINYIIFKSRWLSKVLYPVLRCGRLVYLKLAGRKMIMD